MLCTVPRWPAPSPRPRLWRCVPGSSGAVSCPSVRGPGGRSAAASCSPCCCVRRTCRCRSAGTRAASPSSRGTGDGRLALRRLLGRSPASADRAVQGRGARRRPWRARAGGARRARAGPAGSRCSRVRSRDRRRRRIAGLLAALLAGSVSIGAVYTPGELLAAVPSTLSVLCLVLAHRSRQTRFVVAAGAAGGRSRAGQAVIPRRRLRRRRLRRRLRRLGPRCAPALAARLRRRRGPPARRRARCGWPRRRSRSAISSTRCSASASTCCTRSPARTSRCTFASSSSRSRPGTRGCAGARGGAGGPRDPAPRPRPAGDVRSLAGRRDGRRARRRELLRALPDRAGAGRLRRRLSRDRPGPACRSALPRSVSSRPWRSPLRTRARTTSIATRRIGASWPSAATSATTPGRATPSTSCTRGPTSSITPASGTPTRTCGASWSESSPARARSCCGCWARAGVPRGWCCGTRPAAGSSTPTAPWLARSSAATGRAAVVCGFRIYVRNDRPGPPGVAVGACPEHVAWKSLG